MVQTETFVVDVQAEDEQEATDKASVKFAEAEENGTAHYYGTGGGGINIGTVYDVTGTDDDTFRDKKRNAEPVSSKHEHKLCRHCSLCIECDEDILEQVCEHTGQPLADCRHN